MISRGTPCWATQPVKPTAQARAEQGEVDLLVGADRALEGDRDHVTTRLELVDPGVVVVDDLAGLLDDRPTDCLDVTRAAEPGRGRLEHAQLCSSLLRLGDEVGVLEGDRGMRAEGGNERDIALLPVAGLDGHAGQ